MDLLMGALFVLQIVFPQVAEVTGTLIDLDGERNLPTWYSSTQLSLIGFFLTGYVLRRTNAGEPRAWVLPLAPAVFFFLSLDESARIHEKIGHYIDMIGGSSERVLFEHTGAWMVLCVPLLLLAIFTIAKLTWPHWRDQKAFLRLFCIGMFVLLLGAGGVEIVNNFVSPVGTAVKLQILVEETLEMIGATIILWAAYVLLRDNGVRVFGAAAASDRT